MTALMIGAAAALIGFGMMVVGVRVGQRMQKERCGCDVDPFGMEAGGGCACGGSCGCGS